MSTRAPRRLLPKVPVALSLPVLVLAAAACGASGNRGSEPGDLAPYPPSAAPGAPKPDVEITSPTDGAEVRSALRIAMSASDFTIEPAGPARGGAGHFHLMVDAGCVPVGDPIPLGTAGYHHFGRAQTEASLELAPGIHALCLQAGNGAHAALDLTDEITVTVVGK